MEVWIGEVFGSNSTSYLTSLIFDLYRFSDPEEWLDAGFDDYFNDRSVCCIEWAELANGLIPYIDWQIDIHIDTPLSRILTINGLSSRGNRCLIQLIETVED